MAHKNIPIFIPHMGCPNQCVFCNQRSISGCRQFLPEQVNGQIDTALSTISKGTPVEIAFFGGSFTGIDRGLMIDLLEMAQSYVDRGAVDSIRLSTRPDYINQEILEILACYSVRHIELGLQSMSDGVLQACRRGHTAAQAEEACSAVFAAGFSLTGQMMIGLPRSSAEDEVQTAKKICQLGAESARIYPTVVFWDTPLAEMTQAGAYIPLTVEEAVERSAAALRIFMEHGVPCIRIGLCASEALTSPKQACAGPNHPALGELVWNAYYYQELKEAVLQGSFRGKRLLLTVGEGEISKVVGQRRCNLLRLQKETGAVIVKTVGRENFEGILLTPV